MTDGVMITVKIEVKSEVIDDYLAALPESIAEVASRPGFRDLRCTRNKDNPNLFMWVENWDSEDDYNAYIAWRTERGDMDGYKDIAVGDIEFGYWPETVVSA